MHYGKKHDLPFGIMDVAGLLRLNIRRRAPGQVYVDCPICGDRRGKMNLNTEKDLWRCNYCGEGGGMLSLYAKVYGVSNSDAYREICDALAVNGFSPDYTVPEKTTPAEAEQSDAASVQEVHQTLSMLLSMLTLIPAHREHLRSVRGLSDDEITRFGFKSTPPPFLCRSLTNRLVKAGCRVQGVPGFYVDDNGCWTVKFHQRTSGIIIPIFGVDGLIHGAQIRLDHPLKDKDDPPEKTGVKYLTLSSTGKRMGTTSGSPIHFVGDPCSRVVYVTEGCLKADVAHALMHRTFVATLGVNNTAKLDELFAFLHRNGTEEIIEAEDMDKYSNEMVGKGASKIYALAAKHGMRCRRLTWNPNYKGIDDWQLALRRKEQKMKEDPGMTFKEQYLNGLCGLEMLETCTEKWHAMKVDSISLRDYLGLTEQEYDAYLQTDPGVSFQELLDSQRKTQRFRVYQLELEHGETRAFAFGGIDALHKAGFQQPPAAEYTLVYDGELICPVGQDERDILERIFARYNQAFPPDYRGRSIAPSDVLELYDESERRYFYCDTRIHTTKNTVNGEEKVTAALFCDNERCETRKLRKFVHFASQKAMNIVGLSEAILEKFIGKGWLHSYMDIFFLDKHRSEIVQMEGFGVRSWQNLWDAIQHSRITTFEQYLTAMDIPMVGSTASKAICQRFHGNLSEFETAVCMGFDFTQLPDFGETLHRNIHQWFRSEENWTIWTELRRLVCIKTYQPPAVGTDMSNPFVGKTLVVTGKVEPYTRDGINEKIESLGAHAGSSVSSKTDYLICGENAGSKLAKAQELGIKILSPGEFFRMAGESA